MFTGIVEEIGTLKRITWGAHSAALTIQAKQVLAGTKVGDSIAVNGICLTVTNLDTSGFTADVMHETLNRSSLKGAKPGMHVNLERAMAAGGRFGGHIVSGHVDGIGTIRKISRDDNAIWYTVEASPAILRYIVEKASVTEKSFSVSTIPHTNAVTTLGERKEGDKVNLENDIIGKYVERLLGGGMTECKCPEQPDSRQKQTESKITKEFLTQYGF